MRDIVATIQADQYRLIARDPAPALVVQGGPGTGKTAVGLHRASFLLYTHREELRRILVVGPNPTFMDYVSHVLPILGEENVDQRAVTELVDGVEVGRADPPDVERLKADLRLAAVVERAAELRLAPRTARFEVRLDSAFVRVREDEVEPLLAEIREEHGLGDLARERFRMELVRRLYGQYSAKLGASAFAGADDVERALRRAGLARFVDQVWPVVKPDTLVSQLLGNRTRLAEAADGILDAQEQKLLVRRAAGWSRADLPLLDVARSLLKERPRRYGHVIVDEAQDLTPMELAMVGRRMAGAFTLLGDVAQATGAGAVPRLGRARRAAPGRRGRRDRGARARVPRAARDHGRRAAAARGHRAGGAAAARLPHRRGAAADRRDRRPDGPRLAGGGGRRRGARRDHRARLAARRATRPSPCSTTSASRC